MLKANSVKIEYNETTGRWSVRYQGPSEIYVCTEHGLEHGLTIRQVYLRAAQATLAASYLVLPPMDECEIKIINEN